MFDIVRLVTSVILSLERTPQPLAVADGVPLGSVAVPFAQHLFVDLSDTRFGEHIHEENFVRYSVLRDHPLVGVELGMGLDLIFGRRSACFRVADDKGQRSFSPFFVFDAYHRDFGYTAML